MLLKAMVTFGGIVAASSCLAQDAPKPDADYVARCEMKGHNGMVTFVLCPEVLSSEDFRNEGIVACEGRMPCGAWFWTDAALVAEDVPDSHDKLSQEQVTSAAAIWVNETERLVVLNKSKP